MIELNKIYNMDCLEGLKSIDDNSIDYIITDPPYNVGKDVWDYSVLDLLDNCAKECARVLKQEGIMYWFVPTRHLLKIGFLISQYIPYRWCFVWNTPNNMLGGDIGFSKYTSILIFSKAKSIHRNMQDLKSINWKPNHNGHPTPKPEVLIRYIVEKISKEEDLILDPFMGSGTTAVVCNQLKRKYVGFEISKEYCDIANRRLSQGTLLDITKLEVKADG
jgi:DNA modification methylase